MTLHLFIQHSSQNSNPIQVIIYNVFVVDFACLLDVSFKSQFDRAFQVDLYLVHVEIFILRLNCQET
jgi:hypothetical protein